MSREEKGRLVLQQAIELRDSVREAIRQKRFAGDDIQMKRYNKLIEAAANLFPEDHVMNGELTIMPDANLQAFGTWFDVQTMPMDMPSRRLDERLTFLIDHLRMVIPADKPSKDIRLPQSTGSESIMSELTPSNIDSVSELRSRPIELPPIDVKQFDFVSNTDLRRLLADDYIEVQRTYQVSAFKAATILSGGILEGILYDVFRRPELAGTDAYQTATENFPQKKGQAGINWDAVSLSHLIAGAVKMQILPESIAKMSEGLRDFRDCIHPNAELRDKARAQQEEAHISLLLVRIVYRRVSVFTSVL